MTLVSDDTYGDDEEGEEDEEYEDESYLVIKLMLWGKLKKLK